MPNPRRPQGAIGLLIALSVRQNLTGPPKYGQRQVQRATGCSAEPRYEGRSGSWMSMITLSGNWASFKNGHLRHNTIERSRRSLSRQLGVSLTDLAISWTQRMTAGLLVRARHLLLRVVVMWQWPLPKLAISRDMRAVSAVETTYYQSQEPITR